MIIAICGKCCTGKTAVAKRLAKEIKAKVRSCGEEVEKRAKELGCTLEKLTQEEHIIVDRETHDLIGSVNSHLVIDGSFLPYVLSNISNVLWIELTCNDNIRSQRHRKRQKLTQEKGTINERDVYDESLRKRLYRNRSPFLDPVLRIDTSDKSIEDIVFLITSLMKGNNVNKT